MTITIRNSAVESLILRIGSRTGEAPEAVVERAVKMLNNQEAGAPNEDFEARLAKLMALRPPRDPSITWKDIENEMASIF